MDGKIRIIKKSLLQISEDISTSLKSNKFNLEEIARIEEKYKILSRDLKKYMNTFTNLRNYPPQYMYGVKN